MTAIPRTLATDSGRSAVPASSTGEMGMDVAFCAHFTDGQRQFRVVEAEVHGAAAAIAAGQGAGQAAGVPLDTPIVLRNGRVYGRLCCFSRGGDAAVAERDLRSLRYGARLAARLLDNQQVLRELQRTAWLQH
jgi:hypothetical protein